MPADAMQLPSFGSEPNSYVPRLGLELALAELCELIGKTPACAALTGELGLGKTLLLRVLRERLSGAFECLYVSYESLAPDGLWSRVAVEIGLGSGDDDRGAVRGRARSLAADGSGLVLLVDDAGAMSAETLAELVAACETPGLSLVLALGSEELVRLGELPPQLRRIDIGPPMTLAETRAYAQARLRRLDPGGGSNARLGARTVAELHQASGGVPLRLNALLDAWLPVIEVEASAPPAQPTAVERTLPRPAPAAPDRASAPLSAERAPALELPPALRGLLAQLERPRVRLGMAALFVLLIGGSWYFAMQRGGGTASVGVPVERFEAPSPEPAPQLAPAMEGTPPASAAPAPVAPAEEPGTVQTPGPKAAKASGRAASKRVAAAAPASPRSVPRPAQRPMPDLSLPESPVELVSARFPDEHVPAPLEAAPLAPRPAGPLLSVNAAPWAEIQVDGRVVGETPLGELAVAPGPHVVSARLPDGRVINRRVEAGAGDVYVVFK
jgi:type II secretory pathway predicted ATPase ExeA